MSKSFNIINLCIELRRQATRTKIPITVRIPRKIMTGTLRAELDPWSWCPPPFSALSRDFKLNEFKYGSFCLIGVCVTWMLSMIYRYPDYRLSANPCHKMEDRNSLQVYDQRIMSLFLLCFWHSGYQVVGNIHEISRKQKQLIIQRGHVIRLQNIPWWDLINIYCNQGGNVIFNPILCMLTLKK